MTDEIYTLTVTAQVVPEDSGVVDGYPLRDGMSHFAFVVLCIMCVLCYYGLLIVSARAAGESTSTFLLPLSFSKSLLVSVCSTLRQRLSRRKYNALGDGDDDDDPQHNEPTTRVQ